MASSQTGSVRAREPQGKLCGEPSISCGGPDSLGISARDCTVWHSCKALSCGQISAGKPSWRCRKVLLRLLVQGPWGRLEEYGENIFVGSLGCSLAIHFSVSYVLLPPLSPSSYLVAHPPGPLKGCRESLKGWSRDSLGAPGQPSVPSLKPSILVSRLLPPAQAPASRHTCYQSQFPGIIAFSGWFPLPPPGQA